MSIEWVCSWMERLHREKGGKEDNFSCVSVALDADDIHQLEIDIEAGNLPQTNGAFFGESDGTESDDDLEFIAKACSAIGEGKTVLTSL